ncbi:MAG: hypothetical protein KDA97_07175 [Acidimicrobiales bacterium]|nr:hypothetical protein [Acidimicrobiales bacterium]
MAEVEVVDAVTSADADFERIFDAWHQLDLTAFERWQVEDARWRRDPKVRARR